jgi:hypothetical protein
MNFINKKVLLALAFLGFSGSALGYTWTFTNVTPTAIVIEFTLLAHSKRYFDILNPGEKSTRFDWPAGIPGFGGSIKAGFCIDKFFIGELNAGHLKSLFGKTTFPTMAEIQRVCETKTTELARIGKVEPSIEWISGQRWGTFEQTSLDAVNKLSAAVSDVAGEATNLAIAAGAEAATAGASAGTAGTLAAKMDLGKVFNALSSIPGSVMKLAHKSPCASRHFTILKKDGVLMVATKD